MNNILAFSVLSAFALCGAEAGARTAGWENFNPDRCEVPPAKVLWKADFSRRGDYVLDCRDGAEGEISFEGGRLKIRKKNAKGHLLVKGPEFAAPTNVMLRFFADMHSSDSDVEYSHAFLRAHGRKESLAPQPEAMKFERFAEWPEMAGMVNSAPGMTLRKYALYRSDDGVARAVIVVSGEKSVSWWQNLVCEDNDEAQKLWREKYMTPGRGGPNRAVPRVFSDEELDRRLAADIDHTCRIESFGPYSRMLIDGKPAVPVVYLGMRHLEDYSEVADALPLFERSGVPAIAPIIPTGCCHGQDPYSLTWTEKGFDAKRAAWLFRESMRASGDALMMVTLNCSAFPTYVSKLHPGEGWLDEKGNQVVGTGGSSVVGYSGMMLDKCWPWVSMSSRAWREDVKANIRAFVSELKRQGLAKRLIGIHFQGYNDGQFGMNRPDYSHCAKREYERYVPEALADNRSTNYWHFCRQLNARLVEEFGREFKTAMGKDVIVLRRGDSPFVVDFAYGANMRSDIIDVTVTGPSYVHRLPGVSCSTFVPFSSMSRNGKMLWNEFDLRTWWIRQSQSIIGCRSSGEYQDIESWRAGYRKLAGEMIAARGGFWFYDMGRGWCSGPGIFEDIADSLAVMKKLQEKTPSPWSASVALVIDEEGFFGWDGGERGFPGHTYDISERQIQLMGNAGVPYEYFLAEDVLKRPELLDGKKAVFFMLWRKFDNRRIELVKRLKKSARTLVFLAESGSLGGAKEATGFDIVFSWSGKDFTVVPEPAMKDHVAGVLELRNMRSRSFGANPSRPVPRSGGRRAEIVETDGVVVLGRFESDGKAAIAVKEEDGCRLCYIAEPGGMSPGFFNRLARKSGAYVPVPPSVAQVNMNGDFVSVHALKNASFDFALPFRCKVRNLKSGKFEKVENGSVRLDMTAGQTSWFMLETEGE